MEFTEEKSLIEEYLKWKGELKVVDSSPEAFLIWRTRESAFDKLSRVDDFVNDYLECVPTQELREVLEAIKDIIND